MSSKPVIEVQNLGKTFKLFQRSRDRLLELFTGRTRHRLFTALQDISFALAAGESLGIIGENGSGKSTLLKLIAGILLPDQGTIKAAGKITGLLELGTGFNPELSGRRNIYLNGVYLHLSKQELQRQEEAIIDFAELGPFIDEPLKSYSSGMAMRLGFAIAIHANPQCFIIDEALSVGDARFQQKCFAKLRAFRKQGGSLLFVSHDLNAIKLVCDRALLLSHGHNIYLGEPEQAVNKFNQLLAPKVQESGAAIPGYGNGKVRFTELALTDAGGRPITAIVSGQPFQVHFGYTAEQTVPDVTFGITIRDRFGQDIFGSNGALLNTLATVKGPGRAMFAFSALNLGKGGYTVNLAAHTGTTHLENCFHWWDNAASFEVLEDSNYRMGGIARLPVRLILQDDAHAKV